MENLDILNTTPYMVIQGGKVGEDRPKRESASKKIKLRPTSKAAIGENLGKFPVQEVAAPVASVNTVPEVTAMPSLEVTPAPEVSVTPVTSSNNITTPVPEVPSMVVAPSAPSVTTDSNQDDSSMMEVPVTMPAPKVLESTLSMNPTMPSASEVVSSMPPMASEVGEVRKMQSQISNVVEFPRRVDSFTYDLPKGLKLKEERKNQIVKKVPAPVIQFPVESAYNDSMEDDEFQTLEMAPIRDTGRMRGSASSYDDNNDMYEISSRTSSIGSRDSYNTSFQNEDDMIEAEVHPKMESSRYSDIPSIRKSNSNENNVDSARNAAPVYELCEAIDAQRVVTKAAEEEADRLTRDFQEYKAKSQKAVDISNQELDEADANQAEAERRFQAADHEHKTALDTLIETGKTQQKVLLQRQRDAEAQTKRVVQERRKLEESNSNLLTKNEELIKRYMDRARNLNAQIRIKNEEAAKWMAIAKAMQDPEEDLMGFINTEDISQSYEEDASTKSYGRRAA